MFGEVKCAWELNGDGGHRYDFICKIDAFGEDGLDTIAIYFSAEFLVFRERRAATSVCGLLSETLHPTKQPSRQEDGGKQLHWVEG